MKTTASFALTALLAGVSQVAAYTAVVVSDQTWYGWPDNGYNAQVAYDCLGRGTTAGGDGSYGNPLTYATGSDSELHSPCEITWYPFLEKYMVMQDTCESCSGNHIDIWISNDQGGQSELNCENSNAPSGAGHKLIRYGSSGHSPNTNALWSYANGCQISENCYPNGN